MPEVSGAAPDPNERGESDLSQASAPLASLQQRIAAVEQFLRSAIRPGPTADWAVTAFHHTLADKSIAAALLRALETHPADPARVVECASVLCHAKSNLISVRAEHLLTMARHVPSIGRLAKREQLLCVTGAIEVMEGDGSAELLDLYLQTAASRIVLGYENVSQRTGKLRTHAELALAKAVVKLGEAEPSLDQMRVVKQLFAALLNRTATVRHLEVISGIISACNSAKDPYSRQSLWKESEIFWDELSKRPAHDAEGLLESWQAIIQLRPSAEACRAWRLATDLHLREHDLVGINLLTHHFKELLRPGRPPQLMRQYLESLENGSLPSSAASIGYLSKLAAHGAAFALSLESSEAQAEETIDALALYLGVPKEQFRSRDSELQSYIQRQIEFDGNLAYQYEQSGITRLTRWNQASSELFNPSELLIPPAERAYNAWRRVIDVHDGFGALRTESQRTPDGEMPSLVRFAGSVGQLVMLNARDSEHFPGKGFYLSRLELDRIFVPDPKARGPYHLYKQAWPGYAMEFEHLANAEFIFTRGMIVISCSQPHHYNINIEGESVQMSLVVLNAHFSNPKLEVAYLVDTISLRKLLKSAGIKPDDFRGFDASRSDLNAVIPDFESWLRAPNGPRHALNVGDPAVIARGIFGQEAKSWSEYLTKVDDHNERVKDWDRRFRAMREGLQGIPIADFREEYRLASEGGELEREHEILQRKRFGDHDVWDLTHRLMNLYDLLRISLSYQHRGYIRPREDDLPEDPPDAGAELSNDDSIFLNPAANYMLHETFRWHSQRAQGVEDKARYPVLVIADALNHALGPAKPIMIDSYDMGVYLDGKRVEQLAENGSLSLDDEIYWQTKFLPMAKDEPGRFFDVRLLPRDSLGR